MDYLIDESGLAVSTIRKHYSTLAAFLRWCFEKRLIDEYPMKEIKKPADNSGNKKIEVFTVDELKKIIECVRNEDPMWQALTFCFIDTGARRGEVVAWRWSDLDLLSGRVEIFNNAQYVEGIGVYDTTPKSGKPRVIYLNEQTIAALKKWKKLQKEVVTGQNKPTPEHVFTHIDGRRISPQAPTAYFKRFGDRYEIKNCHPHKFRHSMATYMIRNGVDIKTVSEKLGHSSIEITLKLYVHSDEETQKAANKKYSDILWN
jgi:integrase